jgi:uncharacterized protein (TIGR02996 family)
MTDQEAFLVALFTNRADDTTRLVYADWLDERGDPLGSVLRAEHAAAQVRGWEAMVSVTDMLRQFGLEYGQKLLKRYARIPFSAEILELTKQTHLLFPGHPALTPRHMNRHHPFILRNIESPFCSHIPAIDTAALEHPWYLVRRNHIPWNLYEELPSDFIRREFEPTGEIRADSIEVLAVLGLSKLVHGTELLLNTTIGSGMPYVTPLLDEEEGVYSLYFTGPNDFGELPTDAQTLLSRYQPDPQA